MFIPIFLSLFLSSSSFAADSPKGMVFLVSGGVRATANSCDFYADLKKGEKLFKDWNQQEFVADGSAPEGALNAIKCDTDDSDAEDDQGNPILERKVQPNYQTADVATISETLKAQLAKLPPAQPIVLYFTDHGGRNEVELWGSEFLKVEKLAELLKTIPSSHQVLLIHDHCYGASMLPAILNPDGSPRKNTCGFSSTSANEEASTGESIMNAMDAAPKVSSLPKILHKINYSKDMSSTPMATSTLFLENYLEKRKLEHSEEFSNCAVESYVLGKKLLEFLSPVQEALVEPEMDRLHKSFLEALKGTSYKKDVKAASLESASSALEKIYEELDTESGALGAELSIAKLQYAKTKLGLENYDRFASLLAQIGPLTVQANLGGVIGEKAKVELVEYAKLAGEVNHASADDGDKDYLNFLKTDPESQKNNWFNLNEQKRKDDTEYSHLEHEHRVLERLATEARKLEGLSLILKNHDMAALQQYLGLIQCENFSFR